jgi:hypothetical protein
MTWLTAMAHTLKFNASHVDVIHQRSMMESLTYRLQVARSASNTQLLEKLEKEKQQLAPNAGMQACLRFPESCWRVIKQGVNQILWNGSTLQVHEFSCGSDRWWYTFDPSTGECIYADSEIELASGFRRTVKKDKSVCWLGSLRTQSTQWLT